MSKGQAKSQLRKLIDKLEEIKSELENYTIYGGDMKYKVYKQKLVNGFVVEELVATTFSEHDAKILVKGLRVEQHNQLAYYKEEK